MTKEKIIRKILLAILFLILTTIFFTLSVFVYSVFKPDIRDIFRLPFPRSDCDERTGYCWMKPAIYLYPMTKQEIRVKLNFEGIITTSYPTYNESIKGWEIIAYPDGRIINKSDGFEYNYLFWEGSISRKINWDLSEGFIVEGKKTKDFLQKKLSEIGLIPKEYNDFIVYWLPKMQNNKYNLIRFEQQQYERFAKLDINPKPDSILRVFMVFKPLQETKKIHEQIIKPFERKGFSVIEWGGTEID